MLPAERAVTICIKGHTEPLLSRSVHVEPLSLLSLDPASTTVVWRGPVDVLSADLLLYSHALLKVI